MTERPSPQLSLGELALTKLIEAMAGVRATVVDPELARIVDRVSRDNLNEHGFDPFGYSPEYIKNVLPFAAAMYRNYFRVLTYGIENVPTTGRCLLIANHSGQLPVDGAMLATSLLLDADPPRMVRAMVERWVPTLPFASVFMARCGQVVGTRQNCRALLRDEECILVFPEGAAGVSKTYDKRYQLQRFGYGFMRLAIETGTPIVPIAVVGAEDQAPSLYNWKAAARLLGSPAVPITPLMAILGPLGILPMPVRYHIHFGEPIQFEGNVNDDDGQTGRNVKRVKNAIRELIDRGLKQRKGIFR